MMITMDCAGHLGVVVKLNWIPLISHSHVLDRIEDIKESDEGVNEVLLLSLQVYDVE